MSTGHSAEEALRGGEEQSHAAGRAKTGGGKIKNLIFNFRYEIQKVTCRYYVTSRLLSHSKPPLLQWSLSTSDMNKTIILAPDTLNPLN